MAIRDLPFGLREKFISIVTTLLLLALAAWGALGVVQGAVANAQERMQGLVQATEQARQVLEMLEAMSRAAVEIFEAIKEITVGIQQQDQATADIAVAVGEVDRGMKGVVAGTHDTVAAAQELSGLAGQLQKLMKQFRLGEERERSDR